MSESYKKIDKDTVEVTVNPETYKFNETRADFNAEKAMLQDQITELQAQITVIDSKLDTMAAAVIGP